MSSEFSLAKGLEDMAGFTLCQGTALMSVDMAVGALLPIMIV